MVVYCALCGHSSQINTYNGVRHGMAWIEHIKHHVEHMLIWHFYVPTKYFNHYRSHNEHKLEWFDIMHYPQLWHQVQFSIHWDWWALLWSIKHAISTRWLAHPIRVNNNFHTIACARLDMHDAIWSWLWLHIIILCMVDP